MTLDAPADGTDRRGALGRRIAVIVLIGAGLLSALLTVAGDVAVRRGLFGVFEGSVAGQAENLALIIGAPLSVMSEGDEIGSDIQDILRPPFEAAVQHPETVYAGLVRGGKFAVQANDLGLDAVSPGYGDVADARFAGKHASRHALLPGGRRLLEVRVPIVREGRTLGEIALGFTDADMRALHRRMLLTQVAIALFGAGLLSLFLIGYMRRTVAEPLLRIVGAAERVAAGDLLVVEIAAGEGTEIGQVGRAFNRMVERQKGVVAQIQELSRQVLAAANDLVQFTQGSTRSMTQFTGHVGQITTAVLQMAQAAQAASAAAQAAHAAARKGKEVNAGAGVKMGNISASVATAVDSTQDLARSSAKISEIIGMISEIAEQTNLLSLNAAIEAARAGAAGRGFAVVAEEVRKLAASSARRAEDVAQIAQLILKQTEGASGAVTKGGAEVAEGSSLVKDALAQFEEVARSVESIAAQAEQIAASSEETAASAAQAKTSAGEQAAAIHKIAAHCVSLTAASTRLKEIADQFRVS